MLSSHNGPARASNSIQNAYKGTMKSSYLVLCKIFVIFRLISIIIKAANAVRVLQIEASKGLLKSFRETLYTMADHSLQSVLMITQIAAFLLLRFDYVKGVLRSYVLPPYWMLLLIMKVFTCELYTFAPVPKVSPFYVYFHSLHLKGTLNCLA